MKPRKFRTLDGSDKLRTYADEIARLVPLESLDPRAFLADQSVDQHTCDLVLALALAFNDVKGLFFASYLLMPQEPDDKKTPSTELGAFGGLHVHNLRLLLGVIYELLNLLRQRKSTRVLSHSPSQSDPSSHVSFHGGKSGASK